MMNGIIISLCACLFCFVCPSDDKSRDGWMDGWMRRSLRTTAELGGEIFPVKPPRVSIPCAGCGAAQVFALDIVACDGENGDYNGDAATHQHRLEPRHRSVETGQRPMWTTRKRR